VSSKRWSQVGTKILEDRDKASFYWKRTVECGPGWSMNGNKKVEVERSQRLAKQYVPLGELWSIITLS
jgi:hypothetical protein